MKPSVAFATYLQQVRRRVGEIWTASSAQKSPALDQIPNFDQIVAAAAGIDPAHPERSAYIVSVATSLLGRASSVDCENPPTTPPVFPADHRLHLSMGAEWYWVGAHLQVTNAADPTDTGRIAVLYSIQRRRAVGLTVQALAGWDDTAAQIASAVGTVTVETKTEKSYHRRLPNIQWTAVGGSAQFSGPNEPLLFRCGTDSVVGSVDVLPLKMVMDDGKLSVKLTLSNSRMAAKDAFFLQGGVPAPGVTPLPTPGIYYSWPQLEVAGTVGVAGKVYNITGGSAWLDHQLMATSLVNSGNAATPLPFVDDPTPMNGWSWQEFNLKDGNAFTLASFQQGALNLTPSVYYGFYLTPDAKNAKWIASPLFGTMALKDFQTFPTNAGGGPPSQGPGTVSLPTAWTYLLGSPGPTPLVLAASTKKWDGDGTFNNANGGLASELPVDLVELSIGVPSTTGVGFGETISFEPVPQNHARALAYLASVTPH